MQQKDKSIIILLIVLCCAINTSAWTDEQYFGENESCEFNVNPTFNDSTVNNPYWLDIQSHLHGNDKSILSPYFRSNEVQDFCQSYDICKYIYNPSTSSYIKTACCITIEECVTLVYTVDVNGNGYFKAPDNLLTTQLSDAHLIQRYYQSMMNEGHIACAEFQDIDNPGDGDNPDVFGINATATVGNENLNQIYTGFVTLTGDAKKELMSGQDYGFDMGSISGEGGSGDIANTIGWGAMDETSRGHKNGFNVFFYTLIPIIFILLIMKMLGKVLN